MSATLIRTATTCSCGAQLVITDDAIGRPRSRCPKCDGIARTHKHHPDEVLVSQTQTLTKLTAAALPAIQDGQLRCQVCAKGVAASKRFCTTCAAQRKQKPLGETTCAGCGHHWPRKRNARATVKSCEKCPKPVVHCYRCGTQLPADRKLSGVVCTSCLSKKTARHCIACGKSFKPFKVNGRTSRTCKSCRG